MILLRKFLAFPGSCSGRIITYGAYEFELITFGMWSEFTYKKIRKTFINYELFNGRRFATFYIGEYKILLNQSYLTILGINDILHIAHTVCLDERDAGLYRSGSPKEFIHLYTRILAENCNAHATKN